MNPHVRAGFIGILLFASGCGKSLPEADGSPFATIGRAEKLTLYEGLPHPEYESDVVETERKNKATFDLHGYAFYREPLALTDADAGKLKQKIADRSLFDSFSGEKKCGGFHPDWAVEWTVAGQVYQCLFCFGCGEVKMFGPLGETRFDLGDAKSLKDILKPYQKNRPVVIRGPG